MILKIDTTDTQNITVVLQDKKNCITQVLSQSQKKGTQVLLPLINKMLRKNKLSLKNIDQIKVNPGPGSFTGTRVGVAVANALGFALSVPVNGEKDKIIVPVYEKSKFDL